MPENVKIVYDYDMISMMSERHFIDTSLYLVTYGQYTFSGGSSIS